MEAVRCSISSAQTLSVRSERGFLLFVEAGLRFWPAGEWFKEMAWLVAFTRR